MAKLYFYGQSMLLWNSQTPCIDYLQIQYRREFMDTL